MALSVEGLRFRYRRGEELFDGLTHEFSAGAVTALTGASGRGKSTLLYILGLLLTPTAGRVLVHAEEASTLRDGARSRLRATSIGFVFQDSQLDPHRRVIDSVMEPALYAGQHRGEVVARALALLQTFGLEHRSDHRPGQVSGGQAQRLAVCRALVNQPSIVLADEPTGNLDRGNADLVLDALSSQAHQQGNTVVIATHDPHVLTRVDEVVTL